MLGDLWQGVLTLIGWLKLIGQFSVKKNSLYKNFIVSYVSKLEFVRTAKNSLHYDAMICKSNFHNWAFFKTDNINRLNIIFSGV